MALMTSSVDDLLRRAERVTLWATTFLFPLLVLPGITYDEFKVPKVTLLLLGVGIAGSARLARMGRKVFTEFDGRMMAVAGLLLVPLTISWTFSDLKEWALMGQYFRYQGLLPYALFALYGVLVSAAFKGRARTIAWALVLSGAATGIYSLIQAFHLDPLFPVSTTGGFQPTFSSVGNSNFSGAWHAMTLPVAIGLSLSEHGRRREISIVVSLLIVPGVFFSASQGAWLAASGGLLAFAGLLIGRRSKIARVLCFLAVGVLAFVAVGTVVAVTLSDKALELLGPTIQDRAWGWEAALEAWKADPIVGRGPNTFALFSHQFSAVEERIFAFDYTDDPHSVPLFFLASSGLLGALGYLAATAAALWTAFTTFARRPDPLVIGLAAALVAYALQALISLDDPTLRLAFWGITGAVVASRHKAPIASESPATEPSLNSLSYAGVPAACILMGIAVILSWRFVVADAEVRAGVDAALDKRADKATSSFDRAIELREDVWYRYVAGKSLGELATRTENEELFLEMQEHFAAPTVPRPPWSLVTEALLTNAWAEKVDPDAKPRALELLQRAHETDPGGLAGAMNLALVLGDTGRHDDALDVLRSFIPYGIQNQTFWSTWALANARAGNHSIAWEVIQERDLSPADPRVSEALRLILD